MENFRTIVDQVPRIIKSEKEKCRPSHMTLSDVEKRIYEKLTILDKQLMVFGDVAKKELKKELIRDNEQYLKDSLIAFSELQEKPQVHSYQREMDHKFKFSVHTKVAAIIIEYLEEIPKSQISKEIAPPQIKMKTDILNESLSQYGFFELEKVKPLSEQNKVSLVEKISESGLPHAIAMFDFLQFISYLEKKHFDSKYKLNREVSKWFDSDKDGRAVKGNISSLSKNTAENKDRYTAYKHKENVVNDYEQLK